MTTQRKESLLVFVGVLAVALGTSYRITFEGDSKWWLVMILPLLCLVAAYRSVAKSEVRRRLRAEEMTQAHLEAGAEEIRRRMNAEKALADVWAATRWMCNAPDRKIEVKFGTSNDDPMVKIEYHTPN